MEINLTGINATLRNRTAKGPMLEPLPERPTIYVHVFMVFSVLLAIVIVSGNLLVIAAYKYNSRLRRRGYTFLISLALSDFLVGVISLPLWICISSLGIGGGNAFYVFFISFDIFSALTSVLHLCIVSIERFLAVCWPFHHQRLSSRVYTATAVFCWGFSAVFASLYPVQLRFNFKKIYVPVTFTLGFLIPLVIIASMYIGIFKIAKALTRKLPRPSMVSSEPADLGRNKLQICKERKTAITLTIITGLFFIAWLPFFILNLTAAFCLPCLPRYSILMWVIDSVKWMHYSNSAVNPFVYAFRDSEMRKTFVRLGMGQCVQSTRSSACCLKGSKYEPCRPSRRSRTSETWL